MSHESQTALSPAPAASRCEQVWIDGQFVPAQQASISVFDHGALYGDGVFEGIRAYNGRIFKLATHLERLYDSAKSIRLEIPYPADVLADAVRQLIKHNEQPNGYIRLCVTRGKGKLGISPFTCPMPTVFIIADTIQLYPQEMYEQGMKIITASTIRNHPAALSPRIKSLNYLNNILAKIEAIDAGVPEAVMLNHQGYVTECTGDNLFIVTSHQGQATICTPPLHAGILEGVTRNVVMQLARDAGYPVLETDLTKHDLYVADEMLLTGTGAEIIAVTHLDGRAIGAGKPGSITGQLIKAFRQCVADDAPED